MKSILSTVVLFSAINAAGALTPAFSATRAKPPNILWIVAENMGPDLGSYGHPLVRTPHVDRLAAQGMIYRLAFDTAPVCSPSRSAFMTGMYQTTIGVHHHRSHRVQGLDAGFLLPDGVRPLPHRMREAGYSTANITTLANKPVGTGKTDLNFEVEGEVLRPGEKPPSGAQSESAMHNFNNSVRLFQVTEWTELKGRQPFYAQVNLPSVERGGLRGWVGSKGNPWNGQTHPEVIRPDQVELPPYYPDHPVAREDWAGYLNTVGGMDARVGEILAQLERDGLADNTVVIFFADNGRLELRGLDWCYDSGDRVPLIVRWPKNFPAPPQYHVGTTSEQLISLLDLTATTLAIAGIPKPAGMQSRVFLGAQADPERKVIFSARDRTDEAEQRIRAVRSHRYRYIRNFMPELPYMAIHRYKEAAYPMAPLLRRLHAEGRLVGPPLALMTPRLPDEELYDSEADPHEIDNLAGSPNPEHQRMLIEMRAILDRWIDETDDKGRFPESPAVVAYWREDAEARFPLLSPSAAPAGGTGANKHYSAPPVDQRGRSMPAPPHPAAAAERTGRSSPAPR